MGRAGHAVRRETRWTAQKYFGAFLQECAVRDSQQAVRAGQTVLALKNFFEITIAVGVAALARSEGHEVIPTLPESFAEEVCVVACSQDMRQRGIVGSHLETSKTE